MRSTLLGTVLFLVLYVAICTLLFNWAFSTHWPAYLTTGLLYFVLNEVLRRRTAKSA